MFHILNEQELRELYLNKLDTKKLHICVSNHLVIVNGKSVWNWDLVIHKYIYQKNGRLSPKYFKDSNKAILDSTQYLEYDLYDKLRELVKKYPAPKSQNNFKNKLLLVMKKMINRGH